MGGPLAYDYPMDALSLPAELEHFAAEAIASGRHRDMSEVITAGLSLLRRAEAARAAFNASPEAAEADGEREGFFTIDEVHQEINDLIDELDRAHA